MANNAEILSAYMREQTDDSASTSISRVNEQAQATAQLAQMQTEWEAAQRADASAQTRKAEETALARDALARAKGEQMTPAEATARLAALENDKDFAKRFMSGEVASRQEFDELTGLSSRDNRLVALLDGSLEKNRPLMHTTFGGEAPLTVQIGAVNAMREKGLSDGAIHEAFTGTAVSSKAQYDACMSYFDDLLSNEAWVARLMKGDREANRQFLAGTIIRTNGYREQGRA